MLATAVVVVDADEPALDATTRRAAKGGPAAASDRLSVSIELDNTRGDPKIERSFVIMIEIDDPGA